MRCGRVAEGESPIKGPASIDSVSSKPTKRNTAAKRRSRGALPSDSEAGGRSVQRSPIWHPAPAGSGCKPTPAPRPVRRTPVQGGGRSGRLSKLSVRASASSVRGVGAKSPYRKCGAEFRWSISQVRSTGECAGRAVQRFTYLLSKDSIVSMRNLFDGSYLQTSRSSAKHRQPPDDFVFRFL